MSSLLRYKDYLGSVVYSDDDEVFHGKLQGIRDLVTYEGTDVASLKSAFREAVDDHLKTCEVRGKRPEITYKGSFNVRVTHDLHLKAATFAIRHKKKLNTVVSEALTHYLESHQA